MRVLYLLVLKSLCQAASLTHLLEEELPQVLSTIHKIQTVGFPQCQQALYFTPAWTTVASIVGSSSKVPAVIVDSNLILDHSTKIPLVKKPPGVVDAEWCVGWIIILDNPGQLEQIIDIINR